MKKQITNVSPVQTAKVFAALYFVITAPFAIIFGLIAAVSSIFATTPMPGTGFSIAAAVVIPFLYAIFGFIFAVFGAWVYNFVAKHIGGIEFTTTENTNS